MQAAQKAYDEDYAKAQHKKAADRIAAIIRKSKNAFKRKQRSQAN